MEKPENLSLLLISNCWATRWTKKHWANPTLKS